MPPLQNNQSFHTPNAANKHLIQVAEMNSGKMSHRYTRQQPYNTHTSLAMVNPIYNIFNLPPSLQNKINLTEEAAVTKQLKRRMQVVYASFYPFVRASESEPLMQCQQERRSSWPGLCLMQDVWREKRSARNSWR
jgi:hypothetical protein